MAIVIFFIALWWRIQKYTSCHQCADHTGVICRPVVCKGQIPLRYLVADRFEAGRRPAASWNLAYHLAC